MKLRNKIISALAAFASSALAFTACDEETPETPPADPAVTITVKYDNVNIKDTEVDGYDYTYIFSIISDGAVVPVVSDYIDSSAVVGATGDYNVVCTYGGETATAIVHVNGTVYTLDLSQAEITLLTSQVASYNFKSLFTAKKDGAVQTLEDGMISSNVAATAGNYTYSVTYGGITKTLAVRVIDDVIVVPSYTVKTLEASEVGTYDYTNLFSLYVEGEAVKVTDAMIDKSGMASANIGDTVNVGFSYTKDGAAHTATVRVKVVADTTYTLSGKNVVIYPHSENLELETLFEIKRGDAVVPVTNDMISGSVNYSVAGTYQITLSAFDQECTATVTVESGVIIKPVSDTVYVRTGTDKASYSFSSDFNLIINGIGFYAIPEEFFVGLDSVDFSTAGNYTVTLKVPYNTKGIGFGSPKFDYTECEITYAVRERIGSARAIEQEVRLMRGAGAYDVFDNVYAMLNGRRISLTDNPDWVSVLAVYADVKSEPIDITSTDTQHVEIDVYVNGNDAAPIKVEYDVKVRDDVTVTAHDRSVFAGSTLFATELFEVTRNGESIEPTADMITGKVDTFNAGVYYVTLELGGVSATAKVNVFDIDMMGTYKTKLTTIPIASDDDEDEGEGGGASFDDWYGDGEGDWYSAEAAYSAPSRNADAAADASATSATKILGDMVIGTDGTMTVNGAAATMVGGVDETTMLIHFNNYDYALHYDDGIIVLDPDNSVKLGFTELKRPLVYFNAETWEIREAVTIQYGAKHVLEDTSFTSYSIDTFHIVKKDGTADMWFGLYVELAVKTSADTIYDVRWGEVKYADGFTPQANVSSSLTFDGDVYKFTMQDEKVAKIDRGEQIGKYAGHVYTGTIDGKSARLEVSSSDVYTLKIDGSTVFSFGSVEKNNSKNWYADYDTDTVFLYQYEDEKYSYKFSINTENNTFTVEDRDAYYGMYEHDGKFVYLDGYGTGLLKTNPTSYETFRLRYTVNGDVLIITYMRTKPNFEYGKSSEFYIGELLNTLKVKRFETDLFDGVTLENSIITDGAIVKTTKYRFGAATGNRTAEDVKADIRKSISIVTKDGAVSEEDKAANAKNGYVDLSTVSVTASGYYRFAVNVTVGGNKITSYYSLQIVKGSLTDNPLIGSYKGVCFSGYTFAVDANGQVEINTGSAEYFGYAEADGDALKFKAYSPDGGTIVGTVTSIATDAIKLTVAGSVNYTDYYVKTGLGSSRVAGILGTTLREITISGVGKLYVLASSATSVGEIVTLTSLSGGSVENDSIVKLETSGGEVKYLKIIRWNDTKEGIEVLNGYVE